MAYTVGDAFDRFLGAIAVAGDHRDTAIERRDRVVSLVERDFTIVEAFATGSVPRDTAVDAPAILDLVFVLHYGEHIENRAPKAVVRSIHDALAARGASVRENGQSVALACEGWPDVAILPASRVVDDTGNVTAYSIPDTGGERWMNTRPAQHSRELEMGSSRCGPTFRPLIKMAKWWNREHGSALQSYHLEVLALLALRSPLTDLPWDVYSFFQGAYRLAAAPLWHDGVHVDRYLDERARHEVLERLSVARDTAKEAWYATCSDAKDHVTAIRKWQRVFGEAFPAFGR